MLALPLLDELSGGLSVASSPSLSRETGTGLFGLGALLLAAPMVTSFLEAPVLAWSDRHRARRRWLVAAGIAGMALSLAITAAARGPFALATAMLVYGPASGIALGVAEAMAVDAAGARAAQLLARWTFFASVGDVLAPAIVAVGGALGVSWRVTFAACAIALVPIAALAATARGPAHARDDDEEACEPVLASLRSALADRALFAWLLGAAMCTLLDELLAMLAAFWVSAAWSPRVAAAVLVAFAVGGAAGAALLERALARTPPRAALAVSCALCAVAYGAWIFAPWWPLVVALAFVVGAAATPLHPLAKSEAFAARPGRPGLVNGASQAFVVVDLAVPPLLAWIAERHGARAALALLVLQPLALFLLAMRPKRAQ